MLRKGTYMLEGLSLRRQLHRAPAISEWHTAAAPIVCRCTAAPLACLVRHKRQGKGELCLEVEVLRPVEQMPLTSNLTEDHPRSGPVVTGPGEISCTWSLFWGRE